MTDDFTYTTGGDPSLSHRRSLGNGSYGDVHELYDIPTGKAFARKLLHIPRVKREVVEHEGKVIKKICGYGAHTNIVSVLRIGELRNTSYYFIDMELCDLNLEEYIYCEVSPNPSLSIPYFITDAPPPIKAQQIWNVMHQLASGVTYLHSLDMAHRDLKPANILYSRKDSVWKLADFGFTSEATSRSLVSSKDGRGTPSYRAPELLAYDAPSFNKKVDIWSLGCIMYELALRKRAFGNDFATMEYRMEYRVHQKPIPVILDETFGEQCKEPIVTNITNMLQMEPAKRPSATDLVEEFSRQLQVTQLQPHHNVHVLEDFHPVPPPLLPRDDPQFQTQVWPILHVQQDTVSTTPDATSNIIRSVTPPIIRSDSNYQSSTNFDPVLRALWNMQNAPSPVLAPSLRTTANMQAVQSSSLKTPDPVPPIQSVSETAPTKRSDLADQGTLKPGKVISKPDLIPKPVMEVQVIPPHELFSSLKKVGFALDIDRMNFWAWHCFCRLCVENDAQETAIIECQAEFMRCKSNAPPIMELSNLYAAKGDYENAILTSMQLFEINQKKVRTVLRDLRDFNLTEFDIDGSLEVWVKDSLDGQVAFKWNMLKVIRIQPRLEQNFKSIKTWFSANVIPSPRSKVSDSQYIHLDAWRGDTANLQFQNTYLLRKTDGHGWTTLHLSVWNMHQDTIEFLLDGPMRPLVNIQNNEGKTALHFAAWNNDQPVLRMLLQAGANVSLQDADGWTALHHAASEGHVECSQILFSQGRANLSALDKDRWTPMHLAAANGHTPAVLELIKLGATVSSRTSNGETPMETAKSRNRLRVVRGMKNAGVAY